MGRTSARAMLAIPFLVALAAVSFGQPAELPDAEVFAPGVISRPDRHEFGSVLSRDGRELYFGVDIDGRSEIWRAVLAESGWTQPEVFLAHAEHSFNDPFLDPAEQRLYFISNRPNPGNTEHGDTDLWFRERTADSSVTAKGHPVPDSEVRLPALPGHSASLRGFSRILERGAFGLQIRQFFGS